MSTRYLKAKRNDVLPAPVWEDREGNIHVPKNPKANGTAKVIDGVVVSVKGEKGTMRQSAREGCAKKHRTRLKKVGLANRMERQIEGRGLKASDVKLNLDPKKEKGDWM